MCDCGSWYNIDNEKNIENKKSTALDASSFECLEPTHINDRIFANDNGFSVKKVMNALACGVTNRLGFCTCLY